MEPLDKKYRDKASGELGASFIVDAGAGAGKTTVLVERVMSIVLGGKTPLERVAAITFTEKAAGELKFRVRERVEGVLNGDGNDGGVAERQHEACKRALTDLETASIGTIHSFCASMLRERPAEAGIDPRFEVMDDFQQRLITNEAWEDWLAGEMARQPAALEHALILGVTTSGLRKIAVELAANRDYAIDMARPPEYPPPEELLDELRHKFELAEEYADCCIDRTDKGYRKIEEFRSFMKSASAQTDPIEMAYLCAGMDIKGAGDKNKWRPREVKDEAKKQLDEAGEAINDYFRSVGHSLSATLLQWLKGFVDYYENLKSRRGLLDFQDLLLKTRDMLRDDKNARRYFQKRFDYALVDEFQDTDPLQTEIVFFLAEDGAQADRWEDAKIRPGKLFLVGDPKQSIYAFRRADLKMYQDARKVLAGQGERAPLSQNFRSVEPIIKWVNHRFERIIGKEDTDIQAAYKQIHESRDSVPSDVKAGVWKLPVKNVDYEQKKIRKDDVRKAEAQTIAAFVKNAVGKWKVYDKENDEWREMEYGDVALLFSRRTGIKHFEEAFKALNIPYVTPGGTAFYQSVEVSAILTALRSIDRPDDSAALVGALRSPFFGFSDEDIFMARHNGMELDYTRALAGDPRSKKFKDAFELLRELHRRRNRKSIASTIEDFYLATLGPALYSIKPSGAQRLANLLKVAELGRAFESGGSQTFGAFVEYLETSEDWSRGQEEAPVVEEGDPLVRLMTIHGAKGLEFPMVILADMTIGKSHGDNFITDRKSAAVETKINPIETEGWAEAKERHDARLDAEGDRLLYVACTRARDYLVIPIPGNGLPKGYTLPLLEELETEEPSAIHIEQIDDIIVDPPEAAPFRFRARLKRTGEADRELERFLEWRRKRLDDISELSRKTYYRTATGGLEKDAGDAAAFGTFVHSVMQRIDLSALGDISQLVHASAAGANISDEKLEEAVGMVERALGSDILRRAASSPTRRAEYPIAVKTDDGLMTGRPDLVFIEDGQLVVVDYKTDSVNTEKEALTKMDESYREQGRLYAQALEKLTGLKVMERVFLFMRPDPPIEVR